MPRRDFTFKLRIVSVQLASAVYKGPPATPDKQRFRRSHEALVTSQHEDFDPSALKPFLDQLEGGAQAAT